MRARLILIAAATCGMLLFATCTEARASDTEEIVIGVATVGALVWLWDSLSEKDKADLSEDLSDYATILGPFLQKALRWAGVEDDSGAASQYLSGYLQNVIGGLAGAAADGDEALYEYLDNIGEPDLKAFIKSEGGAKWLLGLIGRIDPRLRDALWRTENGVDVGVLPEAIQLLFLRGDLPEPTWAAFVDNLRTIDFTDADLQWFIETLYANLRAAHKEPQGVRNPEPSGSVYD